MLSFPPEILSLIFKEVIVSKNYNDFDQAYNGYCCLRLTCPFIYSLIPKMDISEFMDPFDYFHYETQEELFPVPEGEVYNEDDFKMLYNRRRRRVRQLKSSIRISEQNKEKYTHLYTDTILLTPSSVLISKQNAKFEPETGTSWNHLVRNFVNKQCTKRETFGEQRYFVIEVILDLIASENFSIGEIIDMYNALPK